MKNKLNVLPNHGDFSIDEKAVKLGRFPSWLHRKLPEGGALLNTEKVLRKFQMNTVCEEAKCPNRLECYAKKTATFLALGKHCSRSCGFCDISFSKNPPPLDPEEPEKIAASVEELGLKHVVITMVARDDLSDGGAGQIARIIKEVRQKNPKVTIEVLTSDFAGNFPAIDLVLKERPEIFNHNIETVRRLTPRVRHRATYERTLAVLSHVKAQSGSLFVKSGMMVGLGETEQEVRQTIVDLHEAGCDIITIGQYLQASSHKLLVKAFIEPKQFQAYEEYGRAIGIKHMYCGPFMRSSYNAHIPT